MTQRNEGPTTDRGENTEPINRGRDHVPARDVNAALRGILTLVAIIAVGCGGGTSSSPTPVAIPTPTPAAAAVTATGNGNLVLHPSANPAFGLAMETPIRVRETGGGTADWNFARLAFFRNNREIERIEVGADVIRTAGATRIGANSDGSYRLVFRFNSDDFDRIDITLGFSDLSTARQFTAVVPFNSFTDVALSLTPLFRNSTPM